MEEKKHNFIFGDLFGKAMSKMSMRTQYEGTMLGFVFIIISLIVMIVNWIFFAEMTLFWRVFYIVNALCGIVILWSSLLTTFQQYQSYMEVKAVTDLLKESNVEMKGGIKDGR